MASPIYKVPDAPAAGNSRSSWFELQERPQAGSFIESLVFDDQGRLYMVDVAWGRVLRVDGEGVVATVAQYDGQPNGLAIHRGGALISDYRRGLLRLSSLDVGGRVETLVDRFGLDHFRGLNDVLVDASDDAYFTDQGGSGLHDPCGRVYRRSADGQLTLLVDRVPSPNALALDAERGILYFAATRDNAVWRLRLRRDREVAKVGRYVQLSGGEGPDGVAVTGAGWLLVTQLGLGRICLFDQRGELVDSYDCPGEDPTSVVVSPDGRSALVAEASSATVYSFPLPTESR